MYNLIFDLDNTLINTKKLKNKENKKIQYNLQKEDKLLKLLLNKLKYPKYIFSNATEYHVKNILYQTKLSDQFKIIMDRDFTITTKPNLNSYITLLENIEINNDNNFKYIFFDDLIHNLITAKYLGWITVLINENYKNKHESIDYYFPNIYKALQFFIHKFHNQT